MALTDIGKVNGLPRSSRHRNLNFTQEELDIARANNQFFLFGTDPRFPVEAFDESYVVFLESVYTAAGGTFTIEGQTGVISGAIPSPFTQDHSPIRMDGGVKVNGTILAMKGFYLKVS